MSEAVNNSKNDTQGVSNGDVVETPDFTENNYYAPKTTEELADESTVSANASVEITEDNNERVEELVELSLTEPGTGNQIMENTKDMASKLINYGKDCASSGWQKLNGLEKRDLAKIVAGAVAVGALYYAYKSYKQEMTPLEKSTPTEKALFLAVKNGNVDEIKKILSTLESTDNIRLIIDERENTIFHHVSKRCLNAFYAKLALLVGPGYVKTITETKNKNGYTPLLLSLENGCLRLFSKYLQETVTIPRHLGLKTGDGWSILHYMARTNEPKFIEVLMKEVSSKWLIKSLWNLSRERNGSGLAPIELAIKYNNKNYIFFHVLDKLPAISSLLDDIRKIEKEMYKYVKIVKDGAEVTGTEKDALVDKHIKMDGKSIANEQQAKNVIELSEMGFDTFHIVDHSKAIEPNPYPINVVNSVNALGRTALIQKVIRSDPTGYVSDYTGNCSETVTLLNYGSDPFAVDSRGNTVYHYAAMYNNLCVLNALPKVPSNKARLVNDDGLTPFFYTTFKDTIQILLERDIDPHVVSPAGNNFLQVLTVRGETKIAEEIRNNNRPLFEEIKNEGINLVTSEPKKEDKVCKPPPEDLQKLKSDLNESLDKKLDSAQEKREKKSLKTEAEKPPAVVAEEKPSTVEKAPVVAEEKPSIVEEAPVVAEEKPPAVKEAPVAKLEEKPSIVEEAPVVAEEKPSAAEEPEKKIIPVVLGPSEPQTEAEKEEKAGHSEIVTKILSSKKYGIRKEDVNFWMA